MSDKVKNDPVNPLGVRQYGQQVFFSKNDLETIESIEKQLKNQQAFKADFKTKRIYDFFRNKYEMSFDKPKKHMERYEYIVKLYPRDEI